MRILVVVNALPTLVADGAYEKVGQMFSDTDRQFPGAVWSLSIGWSCDSFVNATDLAPVESALATAQKHGTSAFDATGDNASLECKGADEWSSPPGAGRSAGCHLVASDDDGGGCDHAVDGTAGTVAGGVRMVRFAAVAGHERWCVAAVCAAEMAGEVAVDRDKDRRRLSPDVAAVGDPLTGVRFIYSQNEYVGAGTSKVAPIWAALTVLMNQYLKANGGRQLGNLNPLLYQVAAGAELPGFRDVSLGGNAVDLSRPGYDLVTGLGTPNTYNLAQNLLEIQSR